MIKGHTLKCYNFWKFGVSVVYYPYEEKIESTDFAMGSRQGSHDTDNPTSQIK